MNCRIGDLVTPKTGRPEIFVLQGDPAKIERVRNFPGYEIFDTPCVFVVIGKPILIPQTVGLWTRPWMATRILTAHGVRWAETDSLVPLDLKEGSVHA